MPCPLLVSTWQGTEILALAGDAAPNDRETGAPAAGWVPEGRRCVSAAEAHTLKRQRGVCNIQTKTNIRTYTSSSSAFTFPSQHTYESNAQRTEEIRVFVFARQRRIVKTTFRNENGLRATLYEAHFEMFTLSMQQNEAGALQHDILAAQTHLSSPIKGDPHEPSVRGRHCQTPPPLTATISKYQKDDHSGYYESNFRFMVRKKSRTTKRAIKHTWKCPKTPRKPWQMWVC